MRSYAKELRRLAKRIPTTFECEEGCFDCCFRHAWTWTEWAKVNPKRLAFHMRAPCPYASPMGCRVYEQRPLICRLFGNGDVIHVEGYPHPVPFACKRGIKPVDPLPEKELKDIYLRLVGIMRKEQIDIFQTGAVPIQAGPYGPLILAEAMQRRAANGKAA